MLEGTIFNPHRPEGLNFQAGDSRVEIAIKPTDDNCFQQLRLRATYWVGVRAEHAAFVSGVQSGRYTLLDDAPISVPHMANGKICIDADGHITDGYALKFSGLPRSLQTICDEASQTLASSVERFLKLIRWSQNSDTPSQPFKHLSVYWRAAPGPLCLVPRKLQSQIGRSPRGITWELRDQQIVNELWSADREEPLGHELLREATDLLGHAPRSALLCLCSALEAGLKQHISERVPQAAWLAVEMPSPPIHKMLSGYLPKLHPEAATLVNWDALKRTFKLCQELFEDRNQLAHRGVMPERATADIHKYRDAVADTLYVLDVLKGFEWAKELVEPEARHRLGWPDGPRFRMVIRMLECD